LGESVLTRPFRRIDGELRCGDVPAARLAARFGTPLYVYDVRRIEQRYRAFASAFAGVEPLIAYSVKANGNLAVLDRLRRLGCGADITSRGELFRARKVGIPANRIVFAGVGKTTDELREALREGVYGFNVESRGELERLDAVAADEATVAPFAIRVNPDVQSPTPHEYTRTGHATAKFGVPWNETLELYAWASTRPHLRARGIDVHIGSQIVQPEPYLAALERILELADRLRREGHGLEYVDLGGGYGISYDEEPGMDVDALAEEIAPRILAAGLRLILEPGRSIVGDAGVLLTRVEYVKESGGKTFVIVDGGMSELIRPSHYGGYHAVRRVDSRETRPVRGVDVVGPICE